MRPKSEGLISAAERRRFEAARDTATLQLLFKAARLANDRALNRAAAGAPGPPVGPAHTALFPHLDFEGIRLTELAAKVGITKQAVGQLVDDLAAVGVVERAPDPSDRRAKRIRFSRRGYLALMHGLGVLHDFEAELAEAIGPQRMRQLHRTLQLIIGALERSAPAH